MKRLLLLIACLPAVKQYAQQTVYSNGFDLISLQSYTTANSSVQFAPVPSGFTLINDGLANNAGQEFNPNKPFHVPSLKTTGWAVAYNPLENDTFLVSTSWLDTTGLNTDRWVVTPLISNISANSVLTWMAKSPDAIYRDGYEVYATTNTGNLTSQSFNIGDRLFTLADGNSNNGGELPQWTRRSVSLASFAGSQLRFAFRNNSKDLYQLWIDDVEVLTLNNSLDGTVKPVVPKKYVLSNASDSVHIDFVNNGAAAVNAVNVSYQIGNSTVNTENFSFTSALNYGQNSRLKFGIPYSVSQRGYYTMKAWINSVNGSTDQNLSNDTLRYYVTVQSSAPGKVVMVEQFTGAHTTEGVDAQVRGTALQENGAIVVNVHHQDSLVETGSLNLIADYKKDFATALIDRCYYEDLNTVAVDKNYYFNRFSTRKNAVVPASVSILNKNFNPTTRLLSFTVKADFVGEVRGDYRINAYLTENQVCGPQMDTTVNGFNQWNGLYNLPWSFYYLMGYYSAAVDAYILNTFQFRHQNTLVHSFNGSYGNSGVIPATGGTQDQSYQQTFTLTLPATGNISKFREDNLYIVGFVAEYDGNKNHRTVLNATKEKLNTNSEVTGLSERTGTLEFSIYPNPSRGDVYVDAPSTGGDDYQLSIIDALGRRVMSDRTFQGGTAERLDLSGLQDGIYFLKVSSGSENRTEKLLIQKNR